MRLFIFESEANTGLGLRAFAGDAAGRKLPDQFGPWRQIGAVRSESAPPYNLSRDTIETAISAFVKQGYRGRITRSLDQTPVRAASRDNGLPSRRGGTARCFRGLCLPAFTWPLSARDRPRTARRESRARPTDLPCA